MSTKKSYLLGIMYSFILYTIGATFYARDTAGELIDGTTDIPVIQFLLGCVLIPWYLRHKPSLSKGLQLVALGLIGWSFAFTPFIMAITSGLMGNFMSVVLLVGSIIAPICFFFFLRMKELRMQEAVVEDEAEDTEEIQTMYEQFDTGLSIDHLAMIIDRIEDPEVNEKGQAILTSLEEIKPNFDTMDTETKHILHRLTTSDVPQLLEAYLSIPRSKQEELEDDVLHNLTTIQQYIQAVLDGVAAQYVKEMQASMALIQTRYQQN